MRKIAIEVAVEIRERRPYILVHERSLPDSTVPKDDNLRITLPSAISPIATSIRGATYLEQDLLLRRHRVFVLCWTVVGFGG